MSSKIKLNIAIVVTFVLVIVCIIWDWGTPDSIQSITLNPLNTDWSFANININSIIQTILSASLGFLFSVIVIEYVINRTREKEADAKGESRLTAIFSLLYIPLDEYVMATKAITNVNSNVSTCYETLKIPISNEALLDIYEHSLYAHKPLNLSKIDFYIDAVNNLQAVIKSVLLTADLSDNPEESKILIDYLNDTYVPLSTSRNLITDKNVYINSLGTIGKMLEGPHEEIDHNSDAYPFVKLEELIEKHDDFFKSLLSEQQYKKAFWTN
jgi:hypothetical protein